ncbi:unnamed protein product [Psylliodes chrysocephalus]|uniref:U-box domain-containing protein n=1 Tax=Psylliodes chrysocephalus TaxID=3402493 RepID=A0A9P0GGH6_9CUCU|nr:unnamed protein product [Psylliodes chrysocephala]
MINFLDSKFIPKVNCKTPSTESYEVDNLISSKYTDKIRGFISYPSFKPPVEVEFEFICPVNMHYIILNTTVGNQRCNGIELFAKTNDLSYTSIGKCIFDNPGVVFCNSRKYSKSKLPPNFNNEFHLSFFKSNTFKYFLNATGIKILIFRTNKSVPCILSAETWGIPSKFCSQKTIDTINKLANKSILPQISSDVNTEEFRIPEDFRDELTCEIMTLPMTLPSGKTVDQTTLEKHLQSEKSFGRKPCDPFTGIKFTTTLKPVVNAALKSRIDMFIFQNSHREELRNVKRTLGGNASIFPESSGQKRTLDSDNSDLEQAIANAKRSKHFVNFTTDESAKSKCLSCNEISIFLYKLPCDHFYCRSCLLKVCETLKCLSCGKSFVKNDVQKCNF